MYVTTKYNSKRLYQTNAGWNLIVKFRYGSEQWVPLKILKENNPIEVAEFSTARDISNEPSFFWWVTYTFCKRYHIISAVTSNERNNSHKYSIKVPRDIDHPKQLDVINVNRL